MYTHGPNCLPGPISRTSFWRSKAGQTDSQIRHDLVAQVRGEIAAGTYDTSEKWEAALERLFRGMEESA